MGRRENKVETYLKSEVLKQDGISRKWTSPQHAGVPDQIVFYNGKIWFVEVKTLGGKLSSAQEREHERLRNHGANVVVVSGREEVDRFITTMVMS